MDDEEDARLILEQVLRGQGADVLSAASGADALAVMERKRPDVIVSDVGMPEMDGYTLLRRIRALPPSEGGRTPALALTAYARREDAQLAFAAGFQMHAAKPVEPARLATLVGKSRRTHDRVMRGSTWASGPARKCTTCVRDANDERLRCPPRSPASWVFQGAPQRHASCRVRQEEGTHAFGADDVPTGRPAHVAFALA